MGTRATRLAQFVAIVALTGASLFYLFFVMPIWIIGQGLAGAPIFELRPMVLSVVGIGVALMALWYGFYRWAKKPVP
jgi:hypothetical protein